MTKKKLALEIIERLKKEYPDAGCSLEYDEAWKLLVSVRLAAQCTDARVNIVTESLFKKYITAEDFSSSKKCNFLTFFSVNAQEYSQYLV